MRGARRLNRSVTPSSIDEISCVHAEIRAVVVKSARLSNIRHGAEKICLAPSRAPPIRWCKPSFVVYLSASSPLKQATAIQILPPEPGDRTSRGQEIPFFQILIGEQNDAECERGAAMPKIRPKMAKKTKHAAIARIPGRPAKPSPKLSGGSRRVSVEIGEIVRKRAQAEAAIADARKSHERLREAIDILPQGIEFLDADGRYILWNKKYAEIYNRSSDQFKPGARLRDTIRVGVERGDYPEAIGREEEWIPERLTKLDQATQQHEEKLADGRALPV